MDTFGGKLQTKDESADEISGCAVCPHTQPTVRRKISVDRSSGGPWSSIASSVESFLSDARTSVSDFMTVLAEKKDDAISSFNRNVNFTSDNREEMKNSIRREYLELYSHKLDFKFKRSVCAENVENAPTADSFFDESVRKQSLQSGVNQEKVLESLPNIQRNGELSSLNLDSVVIDKPIYRSVSDKVHNWVASSKQLSPEGMMGDIPQAKKKVVFLKSNSDVLQRKFMPTVNEEEIRKSDSELFETVHRKEHTFTFCSTNNQEDCLYTLDSLEERVPSLLTSKEVESDRNFFLTSKLTRDGNTKELSSKIREQHPTGRSKTCLIGTEQPLHGARIVGTMNIAIEFLDKLNKLKLTIETLNILERDHCFTKGMSLFVKVTMTLPNKLEKKCSKVVKGKNIMFFNQDIFLTIEDPLSAIRPFLRCTVCNRRSLFARKRYKPIAETSFYVNKIDSDDRMEHSELLFAFGAPRQTIQSRTK